MTPLSASGIGQTVCGGLMLLVAAACSPRGASQRAAQIGSYCGNFVSNHLMPPALVPMKMSILPVWCRSPAAGMAMGWLLSTNVLSRSKRISLPAARAALIGDIQLLRAGR